ncbi:hypothetical protein JCM6882_006830 [Rhodosporidiobolus microsporus]
MSEGEVWAGLEKEGALKRERGDSVVVLPNFGREGATYLRHILARYDASANVSAVADTERSAPLAHLADYTLFLQDHPPRWDFLLAPRLTHFLSLSHGLSLLGGGSRGQKTGFMSLAPYLSNLCGEDSHGDGSYPGVETIKGVVDPLRWPRLDAEGGGDEDRRQRVCEERVQQGREEEERVAATWGGQFVASRRAVLRNGKGVYERLREIIEAPDGDPIHQQWNPQGPSTQSNPAFGHALERAWPVVFRCADARLERECPERGGLRSGCGTFNPPLQQQERPLWKLREERGETEAELHNAPLWEVRLRQSLNTELALRRQSVLADCDTVDNIYLWHRHEVVAISEQIELIYQQIATLKVQHSGGPDSSAQRQVASLEDELNRLYKKARSTLFPPSTSRWLGKTPRQEFDDAKETVDTVRKARRKYMEIVRKNDVEIAAMRQRRRLGAFTPSKHWGRSNSPVGQLQNAGNPDYGGSGALHEMGRRVPHVGLRAGRQYYGAQY